MARARLEAQKPIVRESKGITRLISGRRRGAVSTPIVGATHLKQGLASVLRRDIEAENRI